MLSMARVAPQRRKELTRSRPGRGAGGSLTISWSSLYFCYKYYYYHISYFVLYIMFSKNWQGQGLARELGGVWQYHDPRYIFVIIIFYYIISYLILNLIFFKEITRSRSSRELGGVWQYHDSRYCFFATTIYRSC